MAKIRDRKIPSWVNSPELMDFSTGLEASSMDSIENSQYELLLPESQSQSKLIFSKKKRLLGIITASLLGLTGILFSFNHVHLSQLEAANPLSSAGLISNLPRPSSAPMPQVQIFEQTFVKILRVPGAQTVVSPKTQTVSNPVLPGQILK